MPNTFVNFGRHIRVFAISPRSDVRVGFLDVNRHVETVITWGPTKDDVLKARIKARMGKPLVLPTARSTARSVPSLF